MLVSFRQLAPLSLAALFFGHCLSIMPGALYQDIAISGSPAGSRFQILADGEVIHEGETPAVVRLRRGDRYVVRLRRDGSLPASYVFAQQNDTGRCLLSLALAIPTLGWGFYIDTSSGALLEIQPERVELQLQPDTPARGTRAALEPELFKPYSEVTLIPR